MYACHHVCHTCTACLAFTFVFVMCMSHVCHMYVLHVFVVHIRITCLSHVCLSHVHVVHVCLMHMSHVCHMPATCMLHAYMHLCHMCICHLPVTYVLTCTVRTYRRMVFNCVLQQLHLQGNAHSVDCVFNNCVY